MSETSPEARRWARAQELFHAALRTEPGHRSAFLDTACAGDAALRDEVASLLEAHDDDSLLDEPAVGPAERSPRERIGPWRLVRPLGEGGMGVVYLAEREEGGFHQVVALKLLRAGIVDTRLEHQLQVERGILARLEHPGIARLIDGGYTEEGQPYFAMEFVEGRTLLEYCDDQRLGLENRVRLFIPICEAVNHAHQQLVVHRDLKPGNILVTPEGTPKLLDFGIAKLLDPAVPDHTRTAPWMTPAYASPEQVSGERVTTLSDVYTLGILLYELLAGRRPYELNLGSPAEIARVVCEQMPGPPSVAVRSSLAGPAAEAVAARRGTTVERLARGLEGDLDTIVLKALAKEPGRRYASAAQLAEDLRRHLSARPVLARPDTLRYRMGKFVRRHRTGVIAAALAFVFLVGGVSATIWQARRATRQAAIAEVQRDRAAAEAEKAGLVTRLMVDIFRLSDPTENLGDTLTAREILDRGVARVEREFRQQPDLQAAVFSEVADVYANLGLLSRAEALANRALELRETLYGPASLEVSATLSQVGRARAAQGLRDAAIDDFRRAIAIREQRLREPDSLLAWTQVSLALELRAIGQGEEAGELLNAALATQRRLFGEGSPETARALLGLASTYHDLGRFNEAIGLFEEALARADTAGRPDPAVATAMLNVGMVRRLREQYGSAEPMLRSAWRMRQTLYGPDHPETLEVQAQLGSTLYMLGRLAASETMLRDGLARSLATLGSKHPQTSTLREALAHVLSLTGGYAEAIRLFDASLSVKHASLPADHPQLMFSTVFAGEPHLERGDGPGARARFNEALAMTRRVEGSNRISAMLARDGLGRAALLTGDTAGARTHLELALAIAREELREGHRYRLSVERHYGALLLELGELARAESTLKAVAATERRRWTPPHPWLGRTLQRLGEVQLAQGRPAVAEATLREALLHYSVLPGTHWRVGTVTSLLGEALRAQGKVDEGQALLARGFAIVRRHLGETALETVRARERLDAAAVSRPPLERGVSAGTDS